MIMRFRSIATAVFLCSLDATAAQGPDRNGLWYAVDETTQFQPALRSLQDEMASDSDSDSGGVPLQQDVLFADTLDTYYDAYQTAWRYMGFYVECSPFEEYYENQRRRRNRDLNENDQDNVDGEQRCRRLLLWAAVRCTEVVVCCFFVGCYR